MTEQSQFWKGVFGDEYISRNSSENLHASNLAFFAQILQVCEKLPESFLELGANIGMNAKALRLLAPKAKFSGVEINEKAAAFLNSIADEVFVESIEDFTPRGKYEFVFTKGVLIHLEPTNLNKIYKKMYDSSSKWILIAEYFNPTPVAIEYRGFKNKLFKRDFAGEISSQFPDLILRKYGFAHSKGVFPQDDISWFLFEKRGNN